MSKITLKHLEISRNDIINEDNMPNEISFFHYNKNNIINNYTNKHNYKDPYYIYNNVIDETNKSDEIKEFFDTFTETKEFNNAHKKISFNISPKGDLIHKIYFIVKLPLLNLTLESKNKNLNILNIKKEVNKILEKYEINYIIDLNSFPFTIYNYNSCIIPKINDKITYLIESNNFFKIISYFVDNIKKIVNDYILLIYNFSIENKIIEYPFEYIDNILPYISNKRYLLMFYLSCLINNYINLDYFSKDTIEYFKEKIFLLLIYFGFSLDSILSFNLKFYEIKIYNYYEILNIYYFTLLNNFLNININTIKEDFNPNSGYILDNYEDYDSKNSIFYGSLIIMNVLYKADLKNNIRENFYIKSIREVLKENIDNEFLNYKKTPFNMDFSNYKDFIIYKTLMSCFDILETKYSNYINNINLIYNIVETLKYNIKYNFLSLIKFLELFFNTIKQKNINIVFVKNFINTNVNKFVYGDYLIQNLYNFNLYDTLFMKTIKNPIYSPTKDVIFNINFYNDNIKEKSTNFINELIKIYSYQNYDSYLSNESIINDINFIKVLNIINNIYSNIDINKYLDYKNVSFFNLIPIIIINEIPYKINNILNKYINEIKTFLYLNNINNDIIFDNFNILNNEFYISICKKLIDNLYFSKLDFYEKILELSSKGNTLLYLNIDLDCLILYENEYIYEDNTSNIYFTYLEWVIEKIYNLYKYAITNFITYLKSIDFLDINYNFNNIYLWFCDFISNILNCYILKSILPQKEIYDKNDKTLLGFYKETNTHYQLLNNLYNIEGNYFEILSSIWYQLENINIYKFNTLLNSIINNDYYKTDNVKNNDIVLFLNLIKKQITAEYYITDYYEIISTYTNIETTLNTPRVIGGYDFFNINKDELNSIELYINKKFDKNNKIIKRYERISLVLDFINDVFLSKETCNEGIYFNNCIEIGNFIKSIVKIYIDKLINSMDRDFCSELILNINEYWIKKENLLVTPIDCLYNKEYENSLINIINSDNIFNKLPFLKKILSNYISYFKLTDNEINKYITIFKDLFNNKILTSLDLLNNIYSNKIYSYDNSEKIYENYNILLWFHFDNILVEMLDKYKFDKKIIYNFLSNLNLEDKDYLIYLKENIDNYINFIKIRLDRFYTKSIVNNNLIKFNDSLFYKNIKIDVLNYSMLYPLEKLIISFINSDKEEFSWKNNLGTEIFESISLNINGKVIERLNSNIIDLKNKLYIKNSNNYNRLIGLSNDLIKNNNKIKYKKNLYIPLMFWFTKELESSLHLYKLRGVNISIDFKFNKFINLINFNKDYMLNKINNLNFKCKLLIQYINLTKIDKIILDNNIYPDKMPYKDMLNIQSYDYEYFINIKRENENFNNIIEPYHNPFNYYIESFINLGKYNLKEKINIINLNINSICKFLYFTVNCENIDKEINIIDKISIIINNKVKESNNEKYFNTLIPLIKFNIELEKNKFLYPFSLYPTITTNTGSINFNEIITKNLEIILSEEAFNILDLNFIYLEIWSCNDNILRLKNGSFNVLF